MSSGTTNHDSIRFSTYSGAPSIRPSIAMSTSTQASNRQSVADSAMNDAQKGTAYNKTGNGAYDDTFSPASAYETEKIAVNPAGASTTTIESTDPRAQDIKQWSAGFERMTDERLQKQRYTMSSQKGDEVSILALGAKVERALGRRMTGQDATFTPRKCEQEHEQEPLELPAELPEKRSIEVEATS